MNLAEVCVPDTASLREALELVTRSGKQIALVVAGDASLAGLVTDGDVRKAILRGVSLDAKVVEAMNRAPIVGRPGIGRAEALAMMRQRRIRHLPLVDAGGRVHDLLLLDELLAPRVPLDTLAVVMAGGEGRRLLPLTQSTPKPLLKVGGKPLVEILIDRLREAGISEVLVSVHHKSDMIRAALGDGERLGVRLEYVEEPRPLGTMGALALIRPRLDRPVFVINGDILTKCDFRAMWEFHLRQIDAAMTVGVSLHQVELPFGELTLDGNRVERVDEKPRKEFPVNAGIYVLNPPAVEAIPEGEYCDATDLIRVHLAGGRRVAAYAINEYWLDVGRHGDLEKAIRDVGEGLLG
jgi:dTDP-glucose pyrophosphorylase